MDMSDDMESNVLVTLRLKYIRNHLSSAHKTDKMFSFLSLGFIFVAVVTAVDDDDAVAR